MLTVEEAEGDHLSTHWLDTIKDDAEMTIADLKEAVRERGAWKVLIYRVVEGRAQLNG